MDVIWVILQFVAVLGLLIFFHELGHFLASKAVGIGIEEFGFGYPPRMLKLFTWKGTLFSLNWIPFGGFVRPKGENDDSVEGGMASAPAWKRLIILLSGPTMNFLIGILVLVIMFSALGTPATNKVMISAVVEASPAEQAKLQMGDLIVAINGEELSSIEDGQAKIKAHLGEEIEMTILRGEETFTVRLTPRLDPPPNQGAVGIGLSNPFEEIPFTKALGSAFSAFWEQTRQTVMLPVNLIRGAVAPEEARIVGFKGIFDIYNQASEMDEVASTLTPTPLPIFRLSVVATVSIALGITNLLPIPALDGGQILFLIPEFIFKKRIPQNVANVVNSVFFMLLILLMVFVTIQDFVNPVITP